MHNKYYPTSVTRRTAMHLLAGLAAVMTLFATAPVEAQNKTLKIGYILSKDSQLGAGSTALAKELANRTKGRVTIEQFPNSALGGEVEMLKVVQLGTIDMA